MPNKREETVRMKSFFVPKDVKEKVDAFIDTQYNAGNSYGAYSNLMTNAVTSYLTMCSTADDAEKKTVIK